MSPRMKIFLPTAKFKAVEGEFKDDARDLVGICLFAAFFPLIFRMSYYISAHENSYFILSMCLWKRSSATKSSVSRVQDIYYLFMMKFMIIC
jgi:hypothetical protein